jgi:effector-binding domain-containing protein
MFKIGDFSKLARVSIKMLRHYDEIGLIKPFQVDEITGYRYYSASQLPKLNRILALKEIGFSLHEIILINEKDLDVEDMVAVLLEKKEEIQKTIEIELSKVSRIQAYLKIIKQEEEKMKYEIVIKKIPKLRVISLRDIIENYEEEGKLWMELGEYVKNDNIKCSFPSYAIYHDKGYKETDVDIEVMHTVNNFGQDTDRIKYKYLDSVENMACVVHKGPFQTMNLAYNAVTEWIEENQYEMTAPLRAIYLKGIWNEENPEEWLTEIQVPINRNK